MVRESLKLGLWVLAAIIVTNFVLSLIPGVQVVELFAVTGVTGVTTTLGAKLLGVIQGIIAFNPMSLLLTYLSAVLIIMVGTIAYDNVRIPRVSKAWQRLAAILFYGTAVFYLVLVGPVMKAWNVWVGLLAYYIGVAITLGLLQKQVPKYVKL